MSVNRQLRARRSSTQFHALAGVEREIRSNDRNGSRQYLRNFTQAFRSYEQVITTDQLHEALAVADVVLIGDYHALPACQHFAADLLERRAQPGDRPVILGLETIFSRDQHILDAWWRREIGERELRRRIRFELDWGYHWDPFYQLLVTARDHGEAIYGLDCMPREDLRKIRARDRHATHKIGEIRRRHPEAAIVVLFGESHLAPAHLPQLLRQCLPGERVVTVLQNVDALYWRAAGESHSHVDAVQVSDDVLCAFNTTPLEKYESYRLCLARWRRDGKRLDAAPTIYNLIEALVRTLGIHRYSPHNGTQPKFLVDSLPEVHSVQLDSGFSSGNGGRDAFQRGLQREISDTREVDLLLQQLDERGSAYVPHLNMFYVREFRMTYAAEEAARFLHHACRGLPHKNALIPTYAPADRYFTSLLEDALGYLGSRLLCPQRPASGVTSNDLSQLMEQGSRRVPNAGKTYHSISREPGYALGNRLYEKYLGASLNPASIRKLLLADLSKPGAAKQICRQLASD
ncbi:MAG: ChaN family lipoprotein [Acidobacteriota bacterium]|nr:ChaN family lipoprotein [Acidobacteriota bacterium]